MDETVIAPRIGGKVFELQGYNKQSTTETTGKVIQTAREYLSMFPELYEIVIRIDDDGVGGGVTDGLKEFFDYNPFPVQVQIVPMGNGRKAEDDEHYENRGTEMWAAIRDFLTDNLSAYMQGNPPEIQLPNDEKLISQLTTRKYRMTSKGRIALERKEDMKKRGLDSPDRADAVALAFAPEKEMYWSNERPTGW